MLTQVQAIVVSGECETVDYTRPATDVYVGGVQVVGTLVGVDVHGGPALKLGALTISGIFDVQKVDAVAFAVGASVYWNATATPVGGTATGAATATATDKVLGVCVKPAAAGDPRVRVELWQKVT